MKVTSLALFALVAFACVASSFGLDYCRRAAFQVPCRQLETAMKMWSKQCPGTAPGGKFVAGVGGCCSVVIKAKSSDAFETYRKCVHSTPLYNRAFKPKAAACVGQSGAGPCKVVMAASTAGH